jgi:hypothetical protein
MTGNYCFKSRKSYFTHSSMMTSTILWVASFLLQQGSGFRDIPFSTMAREQTHDKFGPIPSPSPLNWIPALTDRIYLEPYRKGHLS